MPRLSVAAAAAALTLTACNQPTGTTTITSNAETGTVSTATTGQGPSAASIGIQPGKWETTVSVVESKTTGLPPGMPTPPKLGPQKVTACVTPEQASRNPADMLRKAKVDCTITNSVFSGGKLASQASCKLPNGKMTMSTTGTYSATSIESNTEQTMTMGPVVSTQKTHTVSRRIGDCG